MMGKIDIWSQQDELWVIMIYFMWPKVEEMTLCIIIEQYSTIMQYILL